MRLKYVHKYLLKNISTMSNILKGYFLTQYHWCTTQYDLAANQIKIHFSPSWVSLRPSRLDIIAYLDSASNPGSKPQRFSVKNCKSSTSDELQTFKTFFGISCKFLAKNSNLKLFLSATAATLGGTFSKRNH